MVDIKQTNKKKVLMIQGLHEEGLKLLQARDDIEAITIMSSDEDEIMEAAKDVHGITVRTANISRKIIEMLKISLSFLGMVLAMIQLTLMR